ncbi:FadR/GntR family transcriptional regulator [Sphingobium aromaticiconvertens]|uniref:FadR/GntR family transcriptional regulator n=1 Tax=Sphingobium aromaticiconvertens TaxID=365341 RepID=UPI0030188684
MQTSFIESGISPFDRPDGASDVDGDGRGMLLSDIVYDRLFQCISSGQFSQATKLPSENALARSFDVSRPVVRDALKRLRDGGIIYSRQGAGSFVTKQWDDNRAAHGLVDGGQVGSGGDWSATVFRPAETIADIQRCFEFRETIETQTAMLAAQRRNTDMLDRLDLILKRLEQATAGHVHREDIDFEFHLTVARASNNQYFSTVLLGLREQVAVGMHLHGMALLSPDGRLGESTDEHSHILQAIRAGDAQAAGQAMAAHIRNSRDRLFGGGLMDLRL